MPVALFSSYFDVETTVTGSPSPVTLSWHLCVNFSRGNDRANSLGGMPGGILWREYPGRCK